MIKIFNKNPIFSDIICELLMPKINGIYIDGTYGQGGHTTLILQHLGGLGKLYAFDRDLEAVSLAKNISDIRFRIIHSNFIFIDHYITKYNLVGKIDGILLDLGLSNIQLSNKSRGFSFMLNGPLDMRMDQTSGITASQWLNSARYIDLFRVIKFYGEEKFAKRISNSIINYRKLKYLSMTQELVSIIKDNIYSKKYYKHPATRTFLALRIYINNELNNLLEILNIAYKILSTKGRLLVISFNSLEDRIVKTFINNKVNSTNLILPDLPLNVMQLNIMCPKKMKKIGVFKPSNTEILRNISYRSAILRVAEKL